uniref:Hydrophobin n=1 Tax=Mycena chlorophos TaxID=658473 RepID=A0ABQ0LXU5_MYCCL|nr:hydrophobin-251 [Mycena chlorophos]
MRRPFEFSHFLLAVAIAVPEGSPPPPVTTPTSPQCCNIVTPSNSSAALAIASLVGLDLSGIDVPVGLNCADITAVGNDRDPCGGNIPLLCDEPEQAWHQLIAINCIETNF